MKGNVFVTQNYLLERQKSMKSMAHAMINKTPPIGVINPTGLMSNPVIL